MIRVNHENVVCTFHSIMWQRHDPLGGEFNSSYLAVTDAASASFDSSYGSSSSFAVSPAICGDAKHSLDNSTAAAGGGGGAPVQLLLPQQRHLLPVVPLGDAAAEDDDDPGLESQFWIIQVSERGGPQPSTECVEFVRTWTVTWTWTAYHEALSHGPHS
jgi:hypothetical protein